MLDFSGETNPRNEVAWNQATREKWATKIVENAQGEETPGQPLTKRAQEAAEYLNRGDGVGWQAAIYELEDQSAIVTQKTWERRGDDYGLTSEGQKEYDEIVGIQNAIAGKHKSILDQKMYWAYEREQYKAGPNGSAVASAINWAMKQATPLGA